MSQTTAKMSWLHKISIRNKLKYTILGFSLLTLIIFTLVITFTAYEYFYAKTSRDLTILANVFAENVKASLAFDDSKSATTILSALGEDPHITNAILFKHKKVFAVYPDQTPITEKENSDHTGIWLSDGKYYISVPIVVANQIMGKLILVSDLKEWEDVKRDLYIIFFSILLVFGLLTSLISVWLEKQITNRLYDLSAWAKKITETNNFTERAVKENDDEIGDLIDSLNAMLSSLLEQESIVSLNKKLMLEVNERKAAEKSLIILRDNAEAANRAKSAFLATMSHEIRTPLNGVIGMISLVSDTDLTAEQREYLQIIRISGESLLSVINDILDYSKIESGHFELESIDFDLYALVEETVDMLAMRAQEKGLEVGAIIDIEVPRWLNGDPIRIRQVLINLLSNAVKFTLKGEVTVHVSLDRIKETPEEKDITLRVEVTDSGIGISPDTKKELFKPFTQADSSTSRKFGGTGLGLVISKRIVQYMHGEIDVDSVPNVGSKFWFTMQLTRATSVQENMEYEHTPLLEGMHILIVDDSSINCLIVKQQASAWKMRCEMAANGLEALQKLQSGISNNDPYKLILLDQVMPSMSGIELAQKIHANPEFAHTEIIMMTSIGRTVATMELYKIGISACLTKPVKPSKLYNSIMNIMHQSKFKQPLKKINADPSTSIEGYKFKPSRILIAEDFPINQQVILTLLKKLGLTKIDTAINGVEVLKALEKTPYDLILMDCQMPEMDGYMATLEIRKIEAAKGKAHIPIVAMTANALIGDREKCLKVGMDDYIAKPIDRNELIRVLMIWLGDTASTKDKELQSKVDNQKTTQKDTSDLVVDLERLQSITGEDHHDKAHFLQIFIDATQPLMVELEQAIKSRDLETSKKHCHRLKGSAGNCGINQMYELAKTLESKIQLKEWTEVDMLFEAEQKAFEAVKDFVRKF